MQRREREPEMAAKLRDDPTRNVAEMRQARQERGERMHAASTPSE